jgi:hypothetical protein
LLHAVTIAYIRLALVNLYIVAIAIIFRHQLKEVHLILLLYAIADINLVSTKMS